MILFDIPAALLTVGVPVSHYQAAHQPDRYIVWAEDGQADSIWGDDRMQEQALTGTIDYYTKDEYDPNVEAIQAALGETDLAWRLESVQYEDVTGYVHYEWVWELWLG